MMIAACQRLQHETHGGLLARPVGADSLKASRRRPNAILWSACSIPPASESDVFGN